MGARPPSHWKFVVIMTVVVGVVIALDHAGLLLVPAGDDMQAYDGRQVRVLRVIDGDTIEVDIADRLNDRDATRVRLWGLDAPEADLPGADEATAFAREAIGEDAVTLVLEAQRTRGAFGRVLAHVERADGTCLNEMLLEAGLAEIDERFAHSRLQRYARAANVGRVSGGVP